MGDGLPINAKDSIQPFNLGQYISNDSDGPIQMIHTSMENIFRYKDDIITDRYFAVINIIEKTDIADGTDNYNHEVDWKFQ